MPSPTSSRRSSSTRSSRRPTPIAGTTYYHKRDYTRAIADFDQAIRLNPNSQTAYHDRGLAYRDKGDTARHRRFRPSDQARSEVRGGLRQRGLAQSNKQDYTRAIADLDNAVRLDGKFAGAYNDRGLVNAATGKTDRAIADFTQAIRLNPNYDVAYNNRGLIYRGKGDSDRAHRGLSPRRSRPTRGTRSPTTIAA